MSINYNQQLLQAASLTAKTALLKKGLRNSNEAVKGFMKKMSSVTKSESESEAEEILPSSQFSPLASSTQQVKKSDSTSEDSGEESTVHRTELNYSNKDKNEKIKKSSVNIISNKKIENPASSSDSSDSETENSTSKSDQTIARKPEVIKRMLSLKKSNKDNMKEINSKSNQSSAEESDSSSSSSSSKTSRNTTLKNKNTNIKQEVQTAESEDESSSSMSEDNYEQQASGNNTINNLKKAIPPQKSLNQSKYNEICDPDSDDPEDSYMNTSKEVKSNSYQQVSRTPVENLKKFLEETPGYERTKIGERADISGLDSDDEVYLLRIPKTVDPKILQGLSFSLTKKSKIRTESGKYVISKESDSPGPLLVYSNTLKSINPLGTFKMEKYLKTADQGEIVIEEKKKQPLPENIKIRHPLFGSDYESKIQLEEQIKEKLQQALQRFHVSKKTKKKKREVQEEDMEDKSLLISKILEERFNSVKQSQSSNGSEESGLETKEKKKKKKKKHDKTNDETDNTIQTIENMSGELKAKRQQKSGFEIDNIVSMKQEVESQDESLASGRKKKKKKLVNGSIHQESTTTIENENKKRKKVISETQGHGVLKSIKEEIQTEVETQDESEVDTSKKKKSKKKDRTVETGVNLDNSELNAVDEASIAKKKKKESFAIPKIKTEIESQDEGASLETPSKKKKKSRDFASNIPIKQEPSDESINTKKRRKSILNSTEIIGDVSVTNFKFDVSKIEREEPISKKSKKKPKNDDLINSLLSSARSRLDSGSEEKAPKKKKVS